MTISKETREFISSLIDYYVEEAESYRQIAGNFSEIESISDTAFGIIIGCVYSGFLQAYQSQQLSPGLEDIREFNNMIQERATLIRRAIDAESVDAEPTAGDPSNHIELDDAISSDNKTKQSV